MPLEEDIKKTKQLLEGLDIQLKKEILAAGAIKLTEKDLMVEKALNHYLENSSQEISNSCIGKSINAMDAFYFTFKDKSEEKFELTDSIYHKNEELEEITFHSLKKFHEKVNPEFLILMESIYDEMDQLLPEYAKEFDNLLNPTNKEEEKSYPGMDFKKWTEMAGKEEKGTYTPDFMRNPLPPIQTHSPFPTKPKEEPFAYKPDFMKMKIPQISNESHIDEKYTPLLDLLHESVSDKEMTVMKLHTELSKVTHDNSITMARHLQFRQASQLLQPFSDLDIILYLIR